MISFFANIFGYILDWIYNVVGNYGWAIIIFSIIIKLLLVPISVKQQKTVKKTNKIQEKMKEIKVKYKNNPEKLNKATMELYRTENMSPFSGCLSAIVQIILLFAVFYLVKSPLTYMKKVDVNIIDKYTTISKQYDLSEQNNAYPEIVILREINNIKELKNKDIQEDDDKINVAEINDEELDNLDINMDFFGLNLAQVPTRSSDWKAYIIPFLYVVMSIVSMKFTMATNNKTQNKKKEDEKALVKKDGEEEFDPVAQMNKNMTYIFPIMYLSVALIAPLGLALYWLMNSILIIIERLILNKVIKDEEEN